MSRGRIITGSLLFLFTVMAVMPSFALNQPPRTGSFRVEGGILAESHRERMAAIRRNTIILDSLLSKDIVLGMISDSVTNEVILGRILTDSVVIDSLLIRFAPDSVSRESILSDISARPSLRDSIAISLAGDPRVREVMLARIETDSQLRDSVMTQLAARSPVRDSLLTRLASDTRLRESVLLTLATDSLLNDYRMLALVADSVARDSLSKLVWMPDQQTIDELDKLYAEEGDPVDTLLSKRERRLAARYERRADSTILYNPIFRDSIPISRMVAISLAVPGFSQFYNKQYWKIPVLYSTVAAGVYFGSKENTHYKKYKKEYDRLYAVDRNDRSAIDPVQSKMIKYNTKRQFFYLGALASYIYFIGDGAVNYPGSTTSVKKATTLSTIFPGAGQIYNGSYWKAPIVIGGLATMIYVIDWNNRGYKRFKTAYDYRTDNNDATVDEFTQNGQTWVTEDMLKNYKNSYRRNRDLCIIITAGFYLLNIIDAHVDSHLKSYDISDDLAFRVEPSMTNFYTMSSGRNTNMLGFSLKFNF